MSVSSRLATARVKEVEDGSEAGVEEEPKAHKRREIATDVDDRERVEVKQLRARGKGRAVVEGSYGLELVVHEDTVRVGVEADVVHPDEPRRDVVVHLKGAFAQHEEAVDAGAEGDADDVVGHDGADEAHETLGGEEGAEECREEHAEAVEAGERHDAHCREDRDEGEAGHRADQVGEHPREHAVRAIAAFSQEDRPLHHEERQDRHRHEHEEGGDVEEHRGARVDRRVVVLVAEADVHEADHEA
mmetsp:Transcript_38778/g.90649  ORF Transcript_38778/g.90649 Transcript_38778/m.90649 type:complete len:245 (+) Transcript_38778:292-1026(+)